MTAKVVARRIDKPGQHFDHMLRTARTHHIQLSSMADMKANMLLGMIPVRFMQRRLGRFICWVFSSPGRNIVSSGWRTCHLLPAQGVLSCC